MPKTHILHFNKENELELPRECPSKYHMGITLENFGMTTYKHDMTPCTCMLMLEVYHKCLRVHTYK